MQIMRLHRFYTTEIIDEHNSFAINSAELVNQVRRVFRMKVGDKIVIFSGTGFDYVCNIDSFGEEGNITDNNIIRLRVTASERSRSSSQQKIYLCVAVTKKDTFEWIIEKSTELGVTDIIPIIAERSEKKSLNETRLKKIAVEASEQSGRGTIPMVHKITGLADVVEFLEKVGRGEASPWRGLTSPNKIAFHTEGDIFSASDLVDRNRQDRGTVIFIGPEGGWSPNELEVFHNNNIQIRCLGPQVLRTETAVIVALSLVVFGK